MTSKSLIKISKTTNEIQLFVTKSQNVENVQPWRLSRQINFNVMVVRFVLTSPTFFNNNCF